MKKKILSLLLAGGMILTSLVIPTGGASTVEAAPGDNLVAHYKFDGDFSDDKSDSEGTEPSDSGAGTKPSIIEDTERGRVMNADGDSRATIRTDNPLYNEESLTGFAVSAWINADAVNSFRGIWSFSPGVDEGADGYFGLSTTGTLFYNKSARTPDFLDMYDFENTITADGGWEYITVVMDQTSISMYKDGSLVRTITPSTSGGHGASDMLKYIESTPYIYFGTASPYHDDANSWGSGDFQMDDFKVYDTALTADRVVEEYLADKVAADKVIAADLAAITIPEFTLVDLVLPKAGTSGFTTITWESDPTGVIDGNGEVTRPANGMAEVTLTATAIVGEFSAVREFTVKVPAANPSGDIEIYKEQLTLNAGYISEDITLPTSSGDAKVDWDSSEPDVISKYGKVTRPDENTDVTLTATLSLDGTEKVTKKFKVKVLAKGGNVATYVSNDPGLNTDALRGQIGGMMIAAENEEGTYDVLHKEQPIMYTAQGAKAYVSPQVFRKADGTFGMIAADGGNNNKVFLYNTDDLITYTGETAVTLSGIANISKLYMIYDMTDEEYRLYVANSAGAVYLMTSDDLETFSDAVQTEFDIPAVENAPQYAVWASETALTQAEYDKVTKKFTNPYNTSLKYNKQDEITVQAGEDIQGCFMNHS